MKNWEKRTLFFGAVDEVLFGERGQLAGFLEGLTFQ